MPRPIAGRLTFPEPPEPGAVIGQRALTREWLITLESGGEPGTPIGYATPDELMDVATRVSKGDVRSVAEANMRMVASA